MHHPSWPIAILVMSGCAGPPAALKPPAVAPETSARASPGSTAAAVTTQEPSPIGKVARVPEGTYRMGSEAGESDERPVHDVRIPAFEMDLTEVSVGQYAQCVRAGGCVPAPTVVQFPGVTDADRQLFDPQCNDDRPEYKEHPENCVDWSMADAYCRWAGKRLPTEEEWEYAACGGDCGKALEGQGAAAAILTRERWPFTTQVAIGWPGPFGIYDMAGNVWEWTASPYCPYDHLACRDSRRVVRGGSWSMVDALSVRLTDRSPTDPATRNTNLGFRCARSSP
jgi:formylglycine-generating enzyme required for sulfatase activity